MNCPIHLEFKFLRNNEEKKNKEACKEELKTRFQLARTLQVTRKFHRFVPVSELKLLAYQLCSQANLPETGAVAGGRD